MATEAQTKGCARILVSDKVLSLLPTKIEKPKAGVVVWGWMEARELFGAFQEMLLLPEGYNILGVFFEITRYEWTIVVESDDLPIPNEGEMLPLLMPAYERLSDGTVRLLDMKLLK